MDTESLTSTSEPLVLAGLPIVLPKEVEEDYIPEDILRQIWLEVKKSTKWYDFAKSFLGAVIVTGVLFIMLAIIVSLIDTQARNTEFHWQSTVAILIYIGLGVVVVGVVADELEWRRCKKELAKLIGNHCVL